MNIEYKQIIDCIQILTTYIRFSRELLVATLIKLYYNNYLIL